MGLRTFNAFVATAVVVMGLSGCALTTDRIDLSHKVVQPVTTVQGAERIAVRVELRDQRAEKGKVSSKKNGFGMELAPIVTGQDVGLIVKQALETELKARGFQIGADAALVNVAVDLTRFYSDHKLGFISGEAVADLTMAVNVQSNAKAILYARQIVAQGVEPNTVLLGGENAKRALEKALANGMKQVFDDGAFIDALIAAKRI